MAKKATSFRLNPENESKLKAIAKRDNINLSQAINKLISEYSGKKADSEIPPIAKEVEVKIGYFEKELGNQRQRINILKNQIDFLLKGQNGKGLNRYTLHSKPAQSLERSKQQDLGNN